MIRQAIRTKYLGPTDTKGSRIQAKCDAKTITVHYKSELNSEQNHIQAAKELCKRLGWKGSMATGSIQHEYFHVFK